MDELSYLFTVFAFQHYPNQRLGTRRPDEHSAGALQLGLNLAYKLLHLLVLKRSLLISVIHPGVYESLWIDMNLIPQLAQLAPESRYAFMNCSEERTPSPVVV